MKIEMTASKVEPYNRVDIKIESATSTYEIFDLLTNDDLESLELELSRAVKKLYDYRKQQEELES